MRSISLEFDWERPESESVRENAATWGRFAIKIGDDSVTRVFDKNSKTVRDHIYRPLYPLADWVARNWWALLHEPRNPERKHQARRHNFRLAGEGFAAPDLSLFREGNSIEVAWAPKETRTQPVSFIGRPGREYVSSADVEKALARFLTQISDRLDDLGIKGSFLQDEWNALRRLDEEERPFCIAAGRLGLDPFNLSDETADQIVSVSSTWTGAFAEEFLAAADPEQLRGEKDWMVGLQEQIAKQASGISEDLLKVAQKTGKKICNLQLDLPWKVGYEAARDLRAQLGIDGVSGVSLPAVGVPQTAYETTKVPSGFEGIFSKSASSNRPALLLGTRTPAATRFAIARAIGYLATSPQAEDAGVLTVSETHRQAANRAFAAEFLAPAAGLRRHVRNALVSDDDIGALASRYEVSEMVILHQMHNHKIARVQRGVEFGL